MANEQGTSKCGCGNPNCQSYVAHDIQVLSVNEAMRKRPAMYVGPLDDPKTPTNLLKEALCVAIDKVDEVKDLRISLGYRIGDARISFDVSFPVNLHKNGKRMAELLLTQLFGCREIKSPGNKSLCTMGLVTLVALCSEFNFDTCSDGFEWYQSFENGVPGEFVQGGECDAKRTEFMFTLDESIFGANRRIDAEALRAWLSETFTPEQFTIEDYQPSV